MSRIVRYIAAICALILLCSSFSGCSLFSLFKARQRTPYQGIPEESVAKYESMSPYVSSGSQAYEPVEPRYAYDSLSRAQKELYDGLVENVNYISAEISDLGCYKMPQVIVKSGALDAADIRVTIRAVVDDNPYFFWLSRTFSHMTDEDENYTAVQGYSEFSPSEVSQMRGELDSAINDFYASVPDGLTAYGREKYAHDYVLNVCNYDDRDGDTTSINAENVRSHSVYGALVDHRCVCEGYGMSLQLFLNGLGVECVTLTGMAYDSEADESESSAALHLWNAVKLDGEWYHVDPTWDDQDEPYRRYLYFNVDDSHFLTDHELSPTPDQIGKDKINENGADEMNLFIPSCGSMTYDYFKYECPALTDYNGGAVEDALYEAALCQDSYFTFYIDPYYLDFDEAIQVLFKEQPQYFFSYADNVNYRLSGYEIDDNNLSYYTFKDRGAVTVMLNYY